MNLAETAIGARAAAGAPRRATPRDAGRIVRLLAQAFDDDPLFRWFVREDARRTQALQRFFEYVVVGQTLQLGDVYLGTDDQSVAAWLAPEDKSPQPSLLDLLQMLPLLVEVASWRKLPRMFASAGVLEHHPKSPPHFYLQFIGVDPTVRGMGVGSTLLDATLRAVDAAGAPAYLENSNAKNLRLYERHGFRVTREIRPRDDAPPVWLMWRDAQARALPAA